MFGNIINTNAPDCQVIVEVECNRPIGKYLVGENNRVIPEAARHLEIIHGGIQMITSACTKLTLTQIGIRGNLIFRVTSVVRCANHERTRMGCQ